MLLLFSLISFSFATLVEPDITKANSSLEHFVGFIGYNERSEARHNMPIYYNRSNPTKLYWDSTLSVVQNRTGTVDLNGEPKRPQIVDMRERVWFLHDRVMLSYDLNSQPPSVTINSTLSGNFDELSPLAYHHYEYSEKIQNDYILACVSGKLIVLSPETLTKIIKIDFDCGEYISTGNSIVAIKNQTKITLIKFSNNADSKTTLGNYTFYKTIKVANISSSETFIYDPIRVTRNDIVYVIVSDGRRVSVFDSFTNYEQEEVLSGIPFYAEGVTEYLKPMKNKPFENIISYGQIIVVGTPGYGTSDKPYCGGGYVFFDNILDFGYHPRFVTILRLNGSGPYTYFGYVTSTSGNSAWLGGVTTVPSNYDYPELQFSIRNYDREYCVNSICQCHSNLTFVDGKCQVNKKIKASKTLIIILSILSILIFLGIIVALILIFLVYKKNKKRSPKTKFRIGNFAYEFTPIDNFPLSLSCSTLTFGRSGTEPVPVDEELTEEIYIANNTKKTYRFNFNPQDIQTHHFEISFSPKTGKLQPGYGETIQVKFKFLCTCFVNEIVDVLASKGDEESIEEDHAAIKIGIESAKSIKLDYEEFEKTKVIGEGSFGIVFLGKYRGVDVAIKQTKNFTWPEDVVEAFRKEVQMMDKMRCPYIINFIGAVDTPGYYSIVTEYAKFGSLKNVYENEKFTQLLGLKMLTDVAKGMTFLHAAMIIHRDLKPENVLVVSMVKKEKINAKLSDFGTSRDVSSSNVVASMTQGIGTPLYMAPELLLNQGYGQAVDVFSYAIVCYEVLSRKVPYSDENFAHSWDVSDFVTKGNRLNIPDSFPPEMAKLISDCWVEDPSLRPKFTEIEERVEAVWKKMYQQHCEEKQARKEKEALLAPPKPQRIENFVLDEPSEDNSKNEKENEETQPLLPSEEVKESTEVINSMSLVNVDDSQQDTQTNIAQDEVLSAILDDVI
ncbi:serine-threonine protein kinase, putative [Entamoeba dispar SAW760]|uniref:Serine-threonine protein kinase, putative n=1 Tax=Entamoeba dispar (strain ATCC PRA-260 / SAW760) TaxID=370354 RepID=B0E822_ENTDS|nr:serine-threonine protein kinase, putative [Entamoeba dispar SAW760]EDR29324.1 serine-threonine protein kinase, putative [Entamoeba dispar SAW760]|eukprot:EDR29324.1 serine-threonine protein kinase, putative [Entamoeba dispar SAW760]